MTSTNTYYTKCGRKFEKSTKADVTGYTIDLADTECANCPFQIEVKKGWPPMHDRWECRAGSKDPNHKNEWSGCLEDKNTIHIKSLDNNFLESILEYCKSQSDLGAGYNQDLADCRRTISVSCSSNKKGIAAKKALIEKFFPEITESEKESCRTCANAEIFKNVNHGGSFGNCHKNNGSYPIYVPDSKCKEFKVKEEVIEVKKDTESVNETSEIVSKESENVQAFDYSSVDNETAAYLQEKATRITEIRIKSVMAIGKELKEAQDKLSNNKNGIFGRWIESIGISRQTAQNYIQGFNYIVKNFDNIDSASDIQPSLLFAISKPSAPEELQHAVLSGDITSNKEYQEALKAKSVAEQEAKKANEEKERAEFEAKEFERKWKVRESAIEAHKLALDEEKKRRYQLELDLKRAQDKDDSDEVKSLQHEIESYQLQIGNMNVQIQELKTQMKDKPIEVSASKVVEKLPDEVMDSIYKKVSSLYEGLLRLTETEINIFAQGVAPDSFDDVVQALSDATGVLNNIDSAVFEAQNMNEVATTIEETQAPCDDCQYGTREGLRDEDDKNGMVLCTMYNTLVVNERGCRNFVKNAERG